MYLIEESEEFSGRRDHHERAFPGKQNCARLDPLGTGLADKAGERGTGGAVEAATAGMRTWSRLTNNAKPDDSEPLERALARPPLIRNQRFGLAGACRQPACVPFTTDRCRRLPRAAGIVRNQRRLRTAQRDDLNCAAPAKWYPKPACCNPRRRLMREGRDLPVRGAQSLLATLRGAASPPERWLRHASTYWR